MRVLARLRADGRRTLLAALGLGLAGAMAGAAVTVAFGLGTGFDRSVDRADLPDVIARFAPQPRSRIDALIAALPNVAARSYRVQIDRVGLSAHGHSSAKGSLSLVDVRARRGYTVVAGHDLIATRGDVLIERGLAHEWDLKPGDDISFGPRGPRRIAGIVVQPDNVAFPLATAPRVYLPLQWAERETGQTFAVNQALVWTSDPSRTDITLQQARATASQIKDLRFITLGGVRVLIDQAAGIVIALLGAFSVIALGAAAVMLASQAAADVQRRLPSIGIQRAIGTPRGHVALEHGLAAGLLGLTAGGLGVLVGALAVRGPSDGLLRTLNELPPGGALIPPLIAVVLGISVLVALCSAVPAYRAAGRPPVALLRGAELRRPPRRLRLGRGPGAAAGAPGRRRSADAPRAAPANEAAAKAWAAPPNDAAAQGRAAPANGAAANAWVAPPSESATEARAAAPAAAPNEAATTAQGAGRAAPLTDARTGARAAPREAPRAQAPAHGHRASGGAAAPGHTGRGAVARDHTGRAAAGDVADGRARAVGRVLPGGGFALLGIRLALARRGRAALTVAVLAVSGAVVLLMLGLSSLLLALRDDPGAVGKRYALTAQLPAGAVEQVRALDGVAAAAPRYVVRGADSFSLGEPVKLLAIPGDHTTFEDPPIADGRRLRAAGEAEIGTGLAQALGIGPGGTLAVQLQSGAEVRFKVVGTVRALDEDGRVAYVRPDRLLQADPALPNEIVVKLKRGASKAAVTDELESIGAAPATVGGATTRSGAFLDVLAALLRVVAVLDALVCLYALVQALSLVARERRPTLAGLRAQGAGGRTLATILVSAALALALPAVLFAWALEHWLLAPATGRLAAGYADLGAGASGVQVLAVGGAFVLLALLAAARVTRRAVAEPPVSGLRDQA